MLGKKKNPNPNHLESIVSTMEVGTASAGEKGVDNGLFTRNAALGTIKTIGELVPNWMNRVDWKKN